MLSFEISLTQELWKGFLVFCRFGSALMVYPGIGEVYVPVRIRLGLALVCTYLISGILPSEASPLGEPTSLMSTLEPIVKEIMLGLGAGLLVRLLFLTLETIGTLWGMQTGLGHALLFNPMLSQSASIWGHFLGVYTLALLFISDAHHVFIRGLVSSFQTIPLGSFASSESLATLFHQMGTSSVELALTLSTPLLGAGLVFYTALGLLNRIMPHVQIFFIIQPLQILLGFLLISFLITEGLTLFISTLIHLQHVIWSHG